MLFQHNRFAIVTFDHNNLIMKLNRSKRYQSFQVEWSKVLTVIYLLVKIIGSVIHFWIV